MLQRAERQPEERRAVDRRPGDATQDDRESKSASDQRRIDGEVAKLRDDERRSRSQRQSWRGDDEGDHDPGGDRREAHSRPVAALDEIAQQERRAAGVAVDDQALERADRPLLAFRY